MKEQNIETKTLRRCDCNHFHELGETRTFTIKVTVGKECSMEDAIANLFPNMQAKENAAAATKPVA